MTAFPFRTALDCSTLRAFGLSVPEQIDAAAAAGYAGLELRVADVQAFREHGGRPADLARRARDQGVEIVNGVALFRWTDSDPDARGEGLEQARREIDLLARIGCAAVSVPPSGSVATLSLEEIAQDLVVVDKFAEAFGLKTHLEFWGRSPVLHGIHEASVVLDRSGLVRGSMLVDLFHMYTGGSTVDELASLPASRVGLVRPSDYPAYPPRGEISEADRVMPGDGVAPIGELYHVLAAIGYAGFVSGGLFRRDHGRASAADVASQALRQMLAAWHG